MAALAFLLASHPARNSSVWAHLAAGREVANRGDASAADQPAPRAWLYDLTLYWLHRGVGDAGLVLVKALLFVALALLLFDLGRSRERWWVPAFCTALALLACGTRLLLLPVTTSYLFLGLALWLVRPRGGRAVFPPPWALPVLFLVWANTDAWFLLGLATVGLWWLGQALDGAARPSEEQPEASGAPGHSPFLQLLLSVALLAAVCLLNPNHVRAFAPPEELSWLRREGGPASARVLSPFRADYFGGVGLTPAGLAFFPLLGLGLLSFGLNYRGWRWQRFLPWLALATLSCFEARAVPFFAVLAGPVLSWNLGEVLDRRGEVPSGGPRWRFARILWYELVVILGAALLVSAWPGWLQGPPFEPRRWAVELPPSPLRAAEAARRWHLRGELSRDSRFLHLSGETADAFAWGCPEVRGVRDARLASALRGEADAADWQQRMREAGIDHVVAYDRDRGRLSAVLTRLLADPEQWPLLVVEGDVAVFGWRDPRRTAGPDPFRGRRLDLGVLAYQPASEARAPEGGAGRQPARRRWWDAFWKRTPPAAPDRQEATLYALHAEAMRRGAPERHLAGWEAGQAAALVGAAAGWAPTSGPPDLAGRLVFLRPSHAWRDPRAARPLALGALAESLRQQLWRRQDDAPPELLYLTIRAARRAVVANPDDAQPYLLLGEAYLRLIHATRERAWAERMPELGQLRMAQASAALNRAVSLRPDLAQAHLSLGGLYRDLGYLDLAAHHLRTYLDLARKAGPPPGTDAAAFREEADRFEDGLKQLARAVEDRTREYTSEAAGERVLARASLAREKGLAGLARDVLLDSDVAAFGFDGLLLELELLLGTGRAAEVRDWTDPQHKAALGPSYHWLRGQAMAALGEYSPARQECDALAAAVEPGGEQGDAKGRDVVAAFVARAVLDGVPAWGGLPPLLRQAYDRAEALSRAAAFARVLRRQADVWVLRGLLALEQGEVGEAEDAFRQALVPWQEGAGLDFNGRAVARGYLALLEAVRR